MRIAYVAPSIAVISDMDVCPYAAENLIAVGETHDLAVFVDENTAGSELLMTSGVQVSISPKRSLEVDGSLKVSDAIVAMGIAALHGLEPFDEIWYTSDSLTDLSWYEPSLRGIRQMMVVGSATARLMSPIWGDADLIASHGMRSWIAAGRMCAVDGLITDVSPAAYGLRVAALPSLRPTGLAAPDERPVADDPRLIVLVTRSYESRELAKAIDAAASVGGMSEATTLVIIHDDVTVDGTTAGRSIWNAVPESLQRSTIAVAMRADGVAEGFLRTADIIVCMTSAELAIPAVRAASENVPVRILELFPRTGSDTNTAIDAVAAPDVDVVAIDASQSLSDVFTTVDRGSTVVLHRLDQRALADELAAYDRIGSVDLTIVCEPDGIYGSVSTKVSDAVMVLAAGLSDAARDGLADMTLPEAVRSVLNPANVDRVSLQFLPVPGVDVFEAEWSHDRSGVLPVGRSALDVGPILVVGFSEEREETVSHPEPREWVEGLAWQDRVRLLLPWKWGLLARAMRGRW